jgi:lysine 2,3-aminomutase
MYSNSKQDWQIQLSNFVNTIERLEKYVHLTKKVRETIKSNTTTWGTTPYFASLMERNDPACPIRKQVIPSHAENRNV